MLGVLTVAHHADFLKVAFEAEWHRGRPLSETLPLCERVRKAMPAVLKIWEHGGATPLKENVRQLALWETRAYTGLLRGECTMATPSVRVPIICCFPFRREYYVHGKLIGFLTHTQHHL